MPKLIQISTAIFPMQTQFNGMAIAQRTVAVDDHGQAWELATTGLSSEWKRLPDLPDVAPVEMPEQPLIVH